MTQMKSFYYPQPLVVKVVVETRITTEAVDVNSIIAKLTESSREGCGALVMFMGFVKGVVEGNEVKSLTYEAYENLAVRVMNDIANDLLKSFKIKDVVIIHRIGKLKPGDPTIYIFVTASERSEAFKAAQQALERVKHEVPIFKLEERSDGNYWVIGDGRRVPALKK